MKRGGIKSILDRRKKRFFDHKGEVLIGRVVGVHGIKGEVKVKPESDVFERQMEALETIPLYRGTKKEELKIESIRPYKDIYLVKFKDVPDRTAAEERIGGEIWIDKSKEVELREGEFYYHQLIGLEVVDENGERVGEIVSIMEQPASHILVVRDGEKEVLIPFIGEFVKSVDLKEGKVVVSLLEGMRS